MDVIQGQVHDNEPEHLQQSSHLTTKTILWGRDIHHNTTEEIGSVSLKSLARGHMANRGAGFEL